MKALTIHQPYAEMIMTGEKLVENRTWYTGHRAPLLIHAGRSYQWLDGRDPAGFVFGAIVGIARVVDCVRFSREGHKTIGGKDHHGFLSTHDHAHGPYCWILKDAKRINPIPYRGQQGLFDVPHDVLMKSKQTRDIKQWFDAVEMDEREEDAIIAECLDIINPKD